MSSIVARTDEALVVRIAARRELRYADGGDPAHDRTAHVRAGSGLGWLGSGPGARLVVAQDDTSFLALLDPVSGRADALALDHVVAGRRIFESRLGNKSRKLDLEACASLPDGRVVVIGSGSLPVRERLVVVSPGGGARIVDASALYAELRARREFSGSELNVEGATVLGERFLLFNRGNGAPRDGLGPVDAVATLDLAELVRHLDGGPPAAIRDVTAVDLGVRDGARLTFTDACAHDGVVWFLAAAEASPNAVDDGPVSATAVGFVDLGAGTATIGSLVDEHGAPLVAKVEGLAWGTADGTGERAVAVIDRDDPDLPTELLELTRG